MFGVIGASIASAYNKSLDDALAQQLSPALRNFSIRSVLVNSLSKTLDENRRFETVKVFDTLADGKNVAGFDAVATIIITNWGLPLVERG